MWLKRLENIRKKKEKERECVHWRKFFIYFIYFYFLDACLWKMENGEKTKNI